MIESPNKFSDPTRFPIKFSQKLPKPVFAFGESSFPVSFQFYNQPRTAIFAGVFATQLGVFLTDKNIYTNQSVVNFGLGESNSFALTASGTDVKTAKFYLTTTKTDMSVVATSSSNLLEVRQPLFNSNISHIFCSDNSTRNFDKVIDGGTFYPSAIMKLSVHKMLSSASEDLPAIYTSSRSLTSVVLADKNEWGVVDVEIKVKLLWFMDNARTIPATTSPEVDTPSFGLRLYVSNAGSISEKIILSNKTCVASALYPTSVLKSLGGDYVNLVYWGGGSDGNGIFWGKEPNIIISANGMPIQNGYETALYILDNQLLDYDLSSSSSSSLSSNNSQSSISTVLNTSSLSSLSSSTLSSRSSISSSSNSSQSSPSETSISSSSKSSDSSSSTSSSTALLLLSSSSSVDYNYLRSSSSSLDASLLAKYSFSDNPNNMGLVLDESGHNRNLSVGKVAGGLGPPKWGIDYGISEGGFYFEADSTHCDYLQAIEPFWIAGAKSIGLWIKPSSTGNSSGIPFCISNGHLADSKKTEFAIQINTTSSKLSVWAKLDGITQWEINTPNDSVALNKWNHIVVVHNGREPYVYINGLATMLTYSVNTVKSMWLPVFFFPVYYANRLVVGGAPRYYSPFMAVGFSGQIDEIMIWDEALSSRAAMAEYDKMEEVSSQSFSSQSTISEISWSFSSQSTTSEST